MSQHDFDITRDDANTGIEFRAAVNAALKALASMNSGIIDPAIMYPFQMKVDTASTPAVVYIRKGDNTAWARIGEIDPTSGQMIMDSVTNSDTVDGIHAATVAEADKLLALDAAAKLPASITGDSDTVDGIQAGNLIPIRDAARDLTVVANATYHTYQIDVDASEMVLQDATSDPRRLSVDVTIDTTLAGANGVDNTNMVSGANTAILANKLIDSTALFVTNGVKVGDRACNNTNGTYAVVTAVDSETQLSLSIGVFATIGDDYTLLPTTIDLYVWAIYNGTVVAGLLSLSSTAPTLPTGYTYKALAYEALSGKAGFELEACTGALYFPEKNTPRETDVLYEPGTSLLASSDALSIALTTAWAKVKDIQLKRRGIVTVEFKIDTNGGTQWGQIYLDDNPVGKIHTCTVDTTFSENIRVYPNSHVQVWAKANTTGDYVLNFRIFTKDFTPVVVL